VLPGFSRTQRPAIGPHPQSMDVPAVLAAKERDVGSGKITFLAPKPPVHDLGDLLWTAPFASAVLILHDDDSSSSSRRLVKIAHSASKAQQKALPIQHLQ
jgi:hypothetical protein